MLIGKEYRDTHTHTTQHTTHQKIILKDDHLRKEWREMCKRQGEGFQKEMA